MSSINQTAHQLAAAGVSVIPVAPGTSKRPHGSWKQAQTTIASPADIDQTWTADTPYGLGIVTGAVSGNLEMLELEGRAMARLPELAQLANDSGVGPLWARVSTGWLEQSPSGGIHWLYRTDRPVQGNTKLAADADHQTLAETRGEGGFVVAAPTPGAFHDTGRPWLRIAGGPDSIPTLTDDERGTLHAIIGTLDETPAPEQTARLSATWTATATAREGDVSPGDDYEERTDWADILTPHGWTLVFARGTTRYWRRPGKDTDISATTGHARDRDRLFVFTTSTVFDSETPYTKFGAYAVLEHSGDHSAAATALAGSGYGRRAERHLAAVPQPTPATVPSTSGAAASVPQTDGTAALQPSVIGAGTEALTDTGNAYLTMQRHARRLRYVTDTGKWAAWEGTRWVMAPDDAPAMAAALDTVRALPEDAPALHQHKKKSFAARALTNSVRILRGLSEIRTTADTFDTQNGQLNTPRGVIDLATGQILEPHPTLMHTRQTATVVDFDLPTPQWDRFLTVTFQGDQQLIQFMQRLAGITAHGDTAHHVLPFLHGGGQNGKTVFLETLMRVLGDYATSAPQGFLLAGRDKHETELADLQGRRLVVASEVNESTRFDEAKMKALTGGDRIKARFMRQDFFTFEPTHTLWLMGNHQPAVASGGFSFWRRLRLIPFEHQITAEEKVDDLQGILARDEGPGILAWIVRGYIDALAHGLGDPAAVREATASYAAEEDHLARFMEDRCRIGGGEYVRVDTAELRREYSKWCRAEHEDELVGQAFGRRLRQEFQLGEARSNGRRFYTNVTLYSDEGDAEETEKEGSPWTGF